MVKKPIPSRIYLKNKVGLLKIMNIFNLPDESVAMTFYDYKKEAFFILQNDKRENIETIDEKNQPKITFHQSGIIKLTSKTSKNNNIDRITWKGKPFRKIKRPHRMMEVLLPSKLFRANKNFRDDRDIILDAITFPNKQLRITLFCTRKRFFNKLKDPHWVDTSECEYSRSLIRKNLVWTWVLRISRLDTGKPSDHLYYFIQGKIKWPK